MRVLVLGEGPTDLGRVSADGTLEHEGTLPILVRRLLVEKKSATAIEIRAKELKHVRLLPGTSRKIGPSQSGYANKLRVLLGLKEGREADAVVAVVDRDGERNKDRIEELTKGRSLLKENGKRCAVGVAIELIEAWLLTDELALRRALEEDGFQRQPDPESLTSRDEKSDQNPKGRLQRILEEALGNAPADIDFPAHYAAIALAAKIETIEARCPKGFAPFSAQVRALCESQEQVNSDTKPEQ